MEREIVIPGQLLSENTADAGSGTYVRDGKVYSLLYGVRNAKNRISVIPFSGKYIPTSKDFVIGTVIDVTPSNWIFNIGSPYDGLLHASEYPRRVDSSQMAAIMDVGDSALLRVQDVSPAMKVELSMRERGLRPLKVGRLIEFVPAKVPRVIGHGGSMVSMLKKETNCEIFVGQNGRVWINGKDHDMDLLDNAIRMIMQQSHMDGLTDRIYQFLKSEKENEKGIVSADNGSVEGPVEANSSDEAKEDQGEISEDTYRKVDALLEETDE
ncbi:MAG: exosome complex RNA-binding protein Rrp4 [Methanolobus sp.]|uniref:exosome complex RNA-binding protein Rrp4 n=1 Tax=Methanolobus sp. TaxID=1874737 RepID=UPI002730E293|nr:exosome complex RNA-binding protein Rrp4 [Methanolobus sp.]MDP2218464.1 exosome complex RNA-binding protein Rrp4 [Methanolobus sp.]